MAAAQRGAMLVPQRMPLDRLAVYRFTVEQYQRMEKEGLFGSDQVELLDGYVTRIGPMNPPHAVSVERVTDELRARRPEGWCVRSEKDISLPGSQPRPDAVIAAGSRDDYADHRPGPGDISLIVEVSDSTLEEDRTSKFTLYASARLPVYWIVNIPQRQLEVYTRPRAGKNPTYRTIQILAATDSVTVTIGTTLVGPILVADLLPPA